MMTKISQNQTIQSEPNVDQHGLKMKVKMTRLYRKQVMKPLVNKIMSLQLLIERELLPKLNDEVDWNHKLYSFGWDEFIRAKHEIKQVRAKDLEEGFENNLPDPEAIITLEQ